MKSYDQQLEEYNRIENLNNSILEQKMLDDLFLYAGKKKSLQIQSYIEQNIPECSTLIKCKNIKSYILHYQRLEKIIHLSVELYKILDVTNTSDQSYNQEYLLELYNEALDIQKDLRKLLPILE